MRGEAITSFAASATVTVTDPLLGNASHGRVMFLDFLRQIHDTSPCFGFLGARLSRYGLAPFFCAQRTLGRTPLQAAGSKM